MSDDDDRVGYELLVPFVSTVSHGGPHDDVSFVAGFEMGKLWAWCSALSNAFQASFVLTIRADCRAQADLIAMNFGARVVDLPTPDALIEGDYSMAPGGMSEWSMIEVTWVPAPDPLPD